MNARRVKSSLWLLAIGLWPALWLAMPYWIVPDFGHGEGQQLIVDMYRALMGISLHLDRSVARHLSHPILIAGAIVMLLTMLAFVLGRKLVHKLDPARYSLQAIWWGVRTTPCMLIWSGGFALITGVILLVDTSAFDEWIIGIAIITNLIVLAFLAQRPDIVEREKPPLSWTPRWPGAAAVLIAAVAWSINALYSVIEALLNAWDWPSGGAVLVFVGAGLIGWLLSIYTSAASLSAWQRGWSLRATASAKSWRTPTTLRTLAALDLRLLGVVVFVVGPPVVMSAVYFIFIAPQIHSWMQSLHQQQAHIFEAMFVQAGRWIRDYWWLGTGWATGATIAASARAIRLIERDAVVTAAEIQ